MGRYRIGTSNKPTFSNTIWIIYYIRDIIIIKKNDNFVNGFRYGHSWDPHNEYRKCFKFMVFDEKCKDTNEPNIFDIVHSSNFFNYMYILFIRKYIWCKLISYFHAINHIIHNFNFIELEQNIKSTILDVCWILFLIYADTLSFVKFDAYNIRLLRFYKNINVLSLVYKWTTFMYRIGVLDTTARYKIEQ